MHNPDYVRETLKFIDANFDDGYGQGYGVEYGSSFVKPTLIDARDMSEYPDGPSDVTKELTETAVVEASGLPGTEYTPEGLGWGYDRVDAGVRLRIEAAHGGRTEWGPVDSAGEFRALVDEVERTLKVERKRPLEDTLRLEVRRREDGSIDWGDRYREDLVVAYDTIEQLP